MSARVALEVVAAAHGVQHRGLEPAERHIVVVGVAELLVAAQHRPREAERAALRRRRFARAARCAGRRGRAGRAASRPCRTLRRPRRRACAEQAVRAPCRDVEQQRVAAGHEQRGERRHRVRMLERRREQMPFHVVHADERRAGPNASALPKVTPTSSAPTSPGACVTATASRSPNVDRASASARSRHRHDARQVRARRDLGHDAAEHAMHVLRQDHERLERRVVAGAATAPRPTSRRTTSRCRGSAACRSCAACGRAHRASAHAESRGRA